MTWLGLRCPSNPPVLNVQAASRFWPLGIGEAGNQSRILLDRHRDMYLVDPVCWWKAGCCHMSCWFMFLYCLYIYWCILSIFICCFYCVECFWSLVTSFSPLCHLMIMESTTSLSWSCARWHFPTEFYARQFTCVGSVTPAMGLANFFPSIICAVITAALLIAGLICTSFGMNYLGAIL